MVQQYSDRAELKKDGTTIVRAELKEDRTTIVRQSRAKRRWYNNIQIERS